MSKILVVDDEPASVSLLRITLGMDYFLDQNGRNALHWIQGAGATGFRFGLASALDLTEVWDGDSLKFKSAYSSIECRVSSMDFVDRDGRIEQPLPSTRSTLNTRYSIAR